MDTKIQSYYQTIADDLPKQHQKILNCLLLAGHPMSRNVIAIKTGFTVQAVCGRVKELLDMSALVVDGRAYDCDSERVVETLSIPYEINQIKPMKKITPKQMLNYIDYLWNLRRQDVDVCSLQEWTNV